MKKNEMGWACGMYGAEMKTGFWWEKPRDIDHLEELEVDGRIILKWIFKKNSSEQVLLAGFSECGN